MAETPAGERGLKRLLKELRRRHVFESAGLYIAAVWMLIEGADILFPVFNVPPVGMRFVVGAAVVAFPFILILAWRFDFSFRGLVRTRELAAPAHEAGFAGIARRSIAILPFTNMTGDADEFFGDGLAEELLNLLSRLPGLKVAARTSSFALKKRDADIREIGALLGVWHVLEGSVRRAGPRVRITAQLIEAPTGFHIWSETFDRKIDDIFAVEDEISSAIVEALQLALGGDEARHQRRASELPTNNIEAHQFVLRANYLLQRRGDDAIKGAIAALEQAVELDSRYAEAYARLAVAEAILHEYTSEPREPGFARAEAHARKAIALDPSQGEPYGVLGYMALRLWRWRDAEQNLQKALEREDSLPTPYQWYSNLLNDLGRHAEAAAAAAEAHALDPLSPTANNVLAFTSVFLNDNVAAAKHAAIAREYGIGGGVPDYIDFIVSLRRGEYEQARDQWEQALAKGRTRPAWVAPVVDALRSADARADALDALSAAQRDGSISKHMLYFHYCLLAETKAFDVADTMLADHAVAFVWMFLPEAEALTRHPCFTKLMDSVGVLNYWQKNGFPARFRATLG